MCSASKNFLCKFYHLNQPCIYINSFWEYCINHPLLVLLMFSVPLNIFWCCSGFPLSYLILLWVPSLFHNKTSLLLKSSLLHLAVLWTLSCYSSHSFLECLLISSNYSISLGVSIFPASLSSKLLSLPVLCSLIFSFLPVFLDHSVCFFLSQTLCFPFS